MKFFPKLIINRYQFIYNLYQCDSPLHALHTNNKMSLTIHLHYFNYHSASLSYFINCTLIIVSFQMYIFLCDKWNI